MSVKLIGISKIKNEADFIEYSCRANGLVLDEIHYIDDNSADNTVDILKSLSNEGATIATYLLKDRHERLKNEQGTVMTWLMHRLAASSKYQNSYICPLDADEIILCSRQYLLNQLNTMPAHCYGLLKWKTFVPISDKISSQDSIGNSFRPLENEQKQFYKVVIPAKYAASSVITKGSHSVTSKDLNLIPYLLDVDLGHFPVRSANQIIAKSLVSAHKTRLRHAKKGENYHLLRLAERIRALDYRISNEDLCKLALDYLGGRQGAIVKDFDLGGLIPDIKLKYESKPIGPIHALDQLITDMTDIMGTSKNSNTLDLAMNSTTIR